MLTSRFQGISLPLIALLVLSSNSIAGHFPDPKRDRMIADWERAKEYTLDYLNAATNELITFEPTPEMRSFARQMLHIAEANYGFASAASGKTSPITFGDLETASEKYN